MQIVNSKFKIIPGFTPTPKFLVRGFTIIELLITIFIFSTVMIMASSSFATSFISGRTRANGLLEANRSLSSVLDIIGQKMANASGKLTLDDGTTIYGFHKVTNSTAEDGTAPADADDNGLLTIVLKGNQCAYFVKDGDVMKMSQQSCLSVAPIDFTNSNWEKISSPNIKIVEFFAPQSLKKEWGDPVDDSKPPPYLPIRLSGKDPIEGRFNSLITGWNIPAYTYNTW